MQRQRSLLIVSTRQAAAHRWNRMAASTVFQGDPLLSLGCGRHQPNALLARRNCPVTPFVIVFVAAALLIVALSAVAKARDRRYRSDLLDWATTRNWTYREGGRHVTGFPPEAEWVSLLPRGRRRRGVRLQLDGTRKGRPVTVAHYRYQTTTSTNSTPQTHTHHLTVIVIRLAARYPAAELQRRGLGLGWGLAVSRAVGRSPRTSRAPRSSTACTRSGPRHPAAAAWCPRSSSAPTSPATCRPGS